jgi:hypothetical protein
MNSCHFKAVKIVYQLGTYQEQIIYSDGHLLCHLTARQYGEVVLPDASTGQGPGTLASKLSRCKEGMARFLESWYKFSGLYECRGTMLIESRLVVNLLLYY